MSVYMYLEMQNYFSTQIIGTDMIGNKLAFSFFK